tara:strand:- start:5423 stop:5701 length:279 start_codon:yes stop_codon:yes gene_type:complete
MIHAFNKRFPSHKALAKHAVDLSDNLAINRIIHTIWCEAFNAGGCALLVSADMTGVLTAKLCRDDGKEFLLTAEDYLMIGEGKISPSYEQGA